MRRAAADARRAVQARLAALEQNLAHLNPRGVLERGYAIVTAADGAIVDDAAQLAVGDAVALAFARGSAEATITRRDARLTPLALRPQASSGSRVVDGAAPRRRTLAARLRAALARRSAASP